MTTETITKIAVLGRNNYTLRNEQRIKINEWGEPTQVAAAIACDTAASEAIRRQGYSGIGAGAWVEITLDDDTTETGCSMDHPLIRALPFGSVRQLRQFISEQQKREIWDGHNHIAAVHAAASDLLRDYRSR